MTGTFYTDVMNSDEFKSMPLSAQLLYSVLRNSAQLGGLVSCLENVEHGESLKDDLRTLQKNGYIKTLNNGMIFIVYETDGNG